jgi:Rrf2 family protein
MKLQKATRLALYAVLELADQPEQQLSRQEIAAKFGVSSNHLSKVLRDLVRAGLVEAVRGAGGGYRFSGNAKRTTLLDIVRLFEPLPSGGPRQTEPGQHTDIGRALEAVLNETNQSIEATMDSISLSTLLMIKQRLSREAAAAAAQQSIPASIA